MNPNELNLSQLLRDPQSVCLYFTHFYCTSIKNCGTAVMVTYLWNALEYFIESDSCFVNSSVSFIVCDSYFIRGKGELANLH